MRRLFVSAAHSPLESARNSSAPTPLRRSLPRALAIVVIAGTLGVACHSSQELPHEGGRGHGEATPGPTSSVELSPRYRDDVNTLARGETSEEAKLALVEELAVDNSDAATAVLLGSMENSSILVSMASIKALSGRSCAVVTEPLERMLDDQEWERRAWAAKVLGDTRCRDALRELTDRLQHERDGRVQQRIEAAITAINEEEKP